MNKYGFARVAVCSPDLSVGNPLKNAKLILEMLSRDEVKDSDVVLFPELCLSGYTCGDLFRSQHLLDECIKGIEYIAKRIDFCKLVLIGAPIAVGNARYNCAVVLNNKQVIGIVPKQHIPNYNEFYESRWFRAANGMEPPFVDLAFEEDTATIPFGIDLLFESNDFHDNKFVVGAEICEDLWMPIPPSSHQCLAGAHLICNLSASNETVAKHEYRRKLVENQSGRCVAAYAYASAGPTESTTDLVFGGHCLIAENGHILEESDRVGSAVNPVAIKPKIIIADVDIQKLQLERLNLTSFRDDSGNNFRLMRIIEFSAQEDIKNLKRHVDGMPFVPRDANDLKARCAEVFGIQCTALATRLKSLPPTKAGKVPDCYIGISGGLDSTLTLLVAVKTYQALGWDISHIHGITMPGFGTTHGTKTNAVKLMELLGISQGEIDIRPLCMQIFKDEGMKPFGIDICPDGNLMDISLFHNKLDQLTPEQRSKGDLGFENVQASVRTLLLMRKGFTLGTGDMSELALGWCTYNADHMSMYNVNCSIPKTLVRFLIKYVADQYGDESESKDLSGWKLFECLMSIYHTTISPELLPTTADGKIEQSTEDIIGPYELHDFFLVQFVRNGFGPEKILWLSDHATFSKKYSRELRKKTLMTFISRFFGQQYKRSCVPDGPKVGSVSLSPRGDWRMPSDADPEIWLAILRDL